MHPAGWLGARRARAHALRSALAAYISAFAGLYAAACSIAVGERVAVLKQLVAFPRSAVAGRAHRERLRPCSVAGLGSRMFGDDTAGVLSCEGAARRHHGPPARERGRRLLCRREFEPPAKTANKTA